MSQWLTKVYEVVDAKDTDGYVKFFVEDCKFRFGNARPFTAGKGSKRRSHRSSLQSRALKHKNMGMWSRAGFEIVEAEVTYTRHDGSTVTVPATTIYRMEGTLAKDCRIFVDISPLYQRADQGGKG